MNLPTSFIWAGTGLTILGLLGLVYCILRALAIRREGDGASSKSELQSLVAINTASVGVAFIGLACVVVGIIL